MSYNISTGLDEFPDINEITEIANELEGRVPYSSTEWRVYPHLRFPCGGTISSVTVVSCGHSNAGGTVTVDIHLLEPAPQDKFGAEATTPRPASTPGPCMRYHRVQRSHFPATATTNSRGPHRFQKVQLSFSEENITVPPKSLLVMRQQEGILLYQRNNTRVQSRRLLTAINSDQMICLHGVEEDTNYDFPLIYVDIGTVL